MNLNTPGMRPRRHTAQRQRACWRERRVPGAEQRDRQDQRGSAGARADDELEGRHDRRILVRNERLRLIVFGPTLVESGNARI